MSPLQVYTPLVIFGISWLEWFITGKKGISLLNRSRWFIFWSCVEVLLAYATLQVWFMGSALEKVFMAIAAVIGCAVGCATSGVVQKKK
jgi:hypothetical protein